NRPWRRCARDRDGCRRRRHSLSVSAVTPHLVRPAARLRLTCLPILSHKGRGRDGADVSTNFHRRWVCRSGNAALPFSLVGDRKMATDEGYRAGEKVDRIVPASFWRPQILRYSAFSSPRFLHASRACPIIP